MKTNQRKSAFTLVEIMMVIAIIGLLFAIAIDANYGKDPSKKTPPTAAKVTVTVTNQ